MGLEASLGYGDLSATYGLDTVALGFSDSIGGPTLQSQVVGGLETDDYYMGMFGLNDQGTNLTNLTDTHQSFLTTMKMKDLIPSRSWAYTAGAPYRESRSLYDIEPYMRQELATFTYHMPIDHQPILRKLGANMSYLH